MRLCRQGSYKMLSSKLDEENERQGFKSVISIEMTRTARSGAESEEKWTKNTLDADTAPLIFTLKDREVRYRLLWN